MPDALNRPDRAVLNIVFQARKYSVMVNGSRFPLMLLLMVMAHTGLVTILLLAVPEARVLGVLAVCLLFLLPLLGVWTGRVRISSGEVKPQGQEAEEAGSLPSAGREENADPSGGGAARARQVHIVVHASKRSIAINGSPQPVALVLATFAHTGLMIIVFIAVPETQVFGGVLICLGFLLVSWAVWTGRLKISCGSQVQPECNFDAFGAQGENEDKNNVDPPNRGQLQLHIQVCARKRSVSVNGSQQTSAVVLAASAHTAFVFVALLAVPEVQVLGGVLICFAILLPLLAVWMGRMKISWEGDAGGGAGKGDQLEESRCSIDASKRLGSGSFADVMSGTYRFSSQKKTQVAVKIFRGGKNLSPSSLQKIKEEVEIGMKASNTCL